MTILDRATENTAAYSLATRISDAMNTVLFLCTGNYYRSRFAEFYFHHLVNQHGLNWRAESRGLQITPGNVGPLSVFTQQECERRGSGLTKLLPTSQGHFAKATSPVGLGEVI